MNLIAMHSEVSVVELLKIRSPIHIFHEVIPLESSIEGNGIFQTQLHR